MLSASKSNVDAWYAKEIPAFRKALRNASTREEVNAAWAALVDKTKVVNYDIPAATPEPLRGALRDYVFQRYNDTFPVLQAEMAARVNEL